MKIIEEKPGDIPASELKDGQIAVITEWDSLIAYSGRIIQRHGDTLVSLGMPSANRWSVIPHGDSYRVRVLAPGTKLEI